MNSDRKIATLFLIALFAVPAAVLAKRTPAPVVEPIVYNGVRYTVPNDKGTKGYVVARDIATGKQLWKKTIFRKCICPFVEHDVQWVFIKQMRLEEGRLVIVNEGDKAYSLDLKTRRVKQLKDHTGLQGEPNKADAQNPAMTPLFQSVLFRRGVCDLRRSHCANALN